MKILHMYPDVMNLYGEYANMTILKRFLEECGAEATFDSLALYETKDIGGYDMYYMGAGTEQNMRLVLKELGKYREVLVKAKNDGRIMLFTGNAMEIFGRKIIDQNGQELQSNKSAKSGQESQSNKSTESENVEIPGLGLGDYETLVQNFRMTGDVVGYEDTPQAPAPQVPTPQAPAPQAPAPQAPAPQAPAPQAPAPQTPVRQETNREANQEANREANQEANRETNREANQEANREANRETNRQEAPINYIVGFSNKCSYTTFVKHPWFVLKMGDFNSPADAMKEADAYGIKRWEGVHEQNMFCTHITGPLLVKNPYLLKKFASLLMGNDEPFKHQLKEQELGYEVTLKALLERIEAL